MPRTTWVYSNVTGKLDDASAGSAYPPVSNLKLPHVELQKASDGIAWSVTDPAKPEIDHREFSRLDDKHFVEACGSVNAGWDAAEIETTRALNRWSAPE